MGTNTQTMDQLCGDGVEPALVEDWGDARLPLAPRGARRELAPRLGAAVVYSASPFLPPPTFEVLDADTRPCCPGGLRLVCLRCSHPSPQAAGKRRPDKAC